MQTHTTSTADSIQGLIISNAVTVYRVRTRTKNTTIAKAREWIFEVKTHMQCSRQALYVFA